MKFFHQCRGHGTAGGKILPEHLGDVGLAQMQRVATGNAAKDVIGLDLLKLRFIAGIGKLRDDACA